MFRPIHAGVFCGSEGGVKKLHQRRKRKKSPSSCGGEEGQSCSDFLRRSCITQRKGKERGLLEKGKSKPEGEDRNLPHFQSRGGVGTKKVVSEKRGDLLTSLERSVFKQRKNRLGKKNRPSWKTRSLADQKRQVKRASMYRRGVNTTLKKEKMGPSGSGITQGKRGPQDGSGDCKRSRRREA